LLIGIGLHEECESLARYIHGARGWYDADAVWGCKQLPASCNLQCFAGLKGKTIQWNADLGQLPASCSDIEACFGGGRGDGRRLLTIARLLEEQCLSQEYLFSAIVAENGMDTHRAESGQERVIQMETTPAIHRSVLLLAVFNFFGRWGEIVQEARFGGL